MFWVILIHNQTQNKHGECCGYRGTCQKLQHRVGCLRTGQFYQYALPCKHFYVLSPYRMLIQKAASSGSYIWHCLLKVYLSSIEYLFWARSMAPSIPLVKSTSILMLRVHSYRTTSVIPQRALRSPPQKGHNLASLLLLLAEAERREDEKASFLPPEEQRPRQGFMSQPSSWTNTPCSALLYKDYLLT